MVRLKHRYLLLNILYPAANKTTTSTTSAICFRSPTPDHIHAGRLVDIVKIQITLLYGDFGLGISLGTLKVIYWSSATSTAILRVPRDHHRLVWAAISHVTEIPSNTRRGDRGPAPPGTPCVVRVVRVSGTIRKAEEELIRRAKRDVVRAKMAQEQGGKAQASWMPGVAEKSPTQVASATGDTHMQSIEDLSGEEDDSE